MNEKRKRPIIPKSKLQTLLAVIAYADEHRVKNVRFHLGMKPVDTQIASYDVSNRLQNWATNNGIKYCMRLASDTVPGLLVSVVICTPKRNCNVFVYFE